MAGTVCGQFCCSDFYNFQDAQNLTTGSDVLTNGIHPLFWQHYWDNASRAEYDWLRPTLRLATHLIESDAFAEFVATAVYGDLYIDVDPYAEETRPFRKPKRRPEPGAMSSSGHTVPTGHDQIFQKDFFNRRFFATDLASIRTGLQDTGEDLHHFQDRVALFRMPKRGQKTANAAMRVRSRAFLARMEGMLRFRVANLSDDPRSTTNGRTSPAEGPLDERQDDLFPFGRRSYIRLHLRNLQDLRHTMLLFQSGDVEELEVRKREFAIANTLIHELGHAINGAVNGHQIGRKVGFRDNPCIETGFDLVAHIYGGIISESNRFLPKPPGPHMMNNDGPKKRYIVMSEWPSGLKYNHYLDNRHTIARRGPVPEADTVTRVPHEFIMKLFTNAFWREVELSGNKGMLRPKGPRWMVHREVRTSTRYALTSLITQISARDTERLRRIVTRQSSVKQALALLDVTEDGFSIMATAGDIWPEEDNEPKVVSDETWRRASSFIAKGYEEEPAMQSPGANKATRKELAVERAVAKRSSGVGGNPSRKRSGSFSGSMAKKGRKRVI